ALPASIRSADGCAEARACRSRQGVGVNVMAELATGSARAVTRRLSGPVDLLALYAQLSERGRRQDTLLFETAARSSIIVERAAVRIECRGDEVVLDALSIGGLAVLDLVVRKHALYV